ncbi:MAG: hypothetical protein ACFFA0_05765 [Promethearchaeota archaeon]
MVDWNIFKTNWDIIWNDPIGWFLELSLFGQLVLLIGIIAIAIGLIFLTYYILKGLAYLLYYLFKGIYFLFKGIFVGLSKLFKGLYYAISRKQKKKEKITLHAPETSMMSFQRFPAYVERNNLNIPSYCTECGQKLTESMQSLLVSRGIAFCFHCGKHFELKLPKNPNF